MANNKLPGKYEWLAKETGPKILLEALKHYGVLEKPGKGSNSTIMTWAKEVGVSGWYTDDDIPWCGLFVGICARRIGYPQPSAELLAAASWAHWGTPVSKGNECLADVLVFIRPGGGHVGFYVGENQDNFLVYGGNQSNAVGFAWIAKTRMVACRRTPWKIAQPSNVRKVHLTFDGKLSTNEA
ncbi:TIGR02594 family protein [Mucilaginibacter sp. Bleaf8]|uniref:TIGR02594 family protein n=1 Tax=Mucilaginibacter sp. Bleaf8 TaxID=2834430 RepID=UPI001BCD39A4|nr:TIGR02594 family protein [Mucilaginibacter sp. Bleaf8]MBS7563377.1 TIGR02594 family protein [Mucilaginibacter sp. Bleaf8]